MKNLFKFKWLLLSFILSIASINQMWAANVFLKPSSDWKSQGDSKDPWFAAYFCIPDTETKKWVTMSSISGTDLFTCEVPTDNAYTKVIFCRMNGNHYGEGDWKYKYNQTSNLDIESADKYCNITGWDNSSEWLTLPTHPSGKVLYFKPSPQWKSVSARFAAYFYGSTAIWLDMTPVTGTENNYYSVTVPSGTFPFMIFCRMDPAKDENSFTPAGEGGPLWGQTSDVAPDGSDALRNFVGMTATGEDWGTGISWGNYSYNPIVIGSFNSWDRGTGVPLTSTGGTAEIELDAHTAVQFLILDGETLYGSSDLFIGQSGSITFTSGGSNSRVVTGDAGSYIFSYDGDHKVSVDFPDTHPSENFVYFVVPDGWTEVWYDRWGASDIYNTGWPGWKLGTTTIGDHTYAFAPLGGTTVGTIIFHKNEKDGSVDIKTGDLSIYAGQNYTGTNFTTDRAGSWSANFPISVTLNKGAHGVANGTASVNYNATALTATPTYVTANTGYTLIGYYDGETKVLNANGSFVTGGVSGYISAEGNWIKKTSCTLIALYTADPLTFKADALTNDWGTSTNWNPACVPTIEHDVTINKPVIVGDAHATAKSIVFNQNGKTGKLTIQPNKGLEVAETITKTTDGSNRLPTGEEDLILESSSAGNASLIFNNSNGCQATVQMYAKGTIEGSTWNWQYVGTPFTGSIPLYNYYGSWMYKWDVDENGWVAVKGDDTLEPFAGYCLSQGSATTHEMGGTLIETDQANDEDYPSVALADGKSIVIANSWTAPIYVGAFTTGDGGTFDFTPATIYLFNTGSATSGSSEGTEAGTYVSVPVAASMVIGKEYIAPMQGFFIKNESGSAGTITLNYNDLVRPGERSTIVAGAMKAPKKENRPNVLKIIANGSKYSDDVYVLEREDFSTGFDNGWDGEKLSFGVESPSVYVINEPGKYDAVSAIPEFEGTKVGFRAGTDTECTIRFEYNGEEELYLDDLKDKKSVLISDENTYKFTTSAEDDEARFVISKMPMQPTSIEDTNYEVNARKQLINGTLYIIHDGKTYNAEGALVK